MEGLTLNKLNKLICIIFFVLFFALIISCIPPQKPNVTGVWIDQSVENGDKITFGENGSFSIVKYNPLNSTYDITLAEGTYTVEQALIGFNEWDNRVGTQLTKLLGLVDIGDIEVLPYEIPQTGGLMVKGIKQTYNIEVEGGELLMPCYEGGEIPTLVGTWKQFNSVTLIIGYQGQDVEIPINLGKEITIGATELSLKYYKLNMGTPIKPNPLEWKLDEIVETGTFSHDTINKTLTVTNASSGNTILFNGVYKYKIIGSVVSFSYPASEGATANTPLYYTQE